jgi:pyruvate kinase
MADPSLVTVDLIRQNKSSFVRKTKIICTLGPACWSVENLCMLLDAGMNVARFNFSHGDVAGHTACLERLREAIVQRPDKPCAILLDTKGPEIRTGKVDPSCGGKLKLAKDSVIEVGIDYEKPCTPEYLACSYKSLATSVKVGSNILVADGALSLRVLEIKGTSVMAKVLNNASFGDTKNMNLPGAIVDLPTLTPKDCNDLVEFGVKQKVDFIAASFVRKASDIDRIREVLGEGGAHVKIIAKIENQEGLDNYDDILTKTDGIMVARGDLGMEIPIERVFLAQKMMVRKANIAGVPVVTATQMLESMITNPRPTRAECADVANAVLDGSDAVMLSGETANGEYFQEAVTMMSNTCLEAESMIDNDIQHVAIRTEMLKQGKALSSSESVASSAVQSCYDVNASAIIALTESGNTARLLSKYRPGKPIVVVTTHPNVVTQVTGYMRGCVAYKIDSMKGTDSVIREAIERAIARGYCKKGDNIIAVFGKSEELAGATDMSRIITA